jgi:hypothetical protein
MRLHLSFVELVSRLTHHERSARSGFDKSFNQQFLHCAPLDWVAIRFPSSVKFPSASAEHRPRCLLRLAHKVHLELNHVLQGVLTSETHRTLWCDHAFSLAGFDCTRTSAQSDLHEILYSLLFPRTVRCSCGRAWFTFRSLPLRSVPLRATTASSAWASVFI